MEVKGLTSSANRMIYVIVILLPGVAFIVYKAFKLTFFEIFAVQRDGLPNNPKKINYCTSFSTSLDRRRSKSVQCNGCEAIQMQALR
uniref:Uncharacterized protein n=1 Tax=Romanomermis culicivorax TaxID=13658 RepID=A0A915JL95_ROMCU